MKTNINNFVSALKQGKTLLYPADTIWGLGCDATNQKAVDAIFKLKNRPKNKPLIALVADVDMLKQYVEKIPNNIEELLQSDQPTTLVYPKGKGLAKGVISENESVAIRIPKPCFVLDLITAFGKPIVSTSANLSGAPIPVTYHEIDAQILARVDEVVPLNKDNLAQIPSRVLKVLPDGSVKQLR
ncbi:MAG: threonylcarbamoyl-AMP synthase [Bacteroidetes bacterium]|nr:threonylcarbamoyl-AMP synthase [Bacteroidota bacterium]